VAVELDDKARLAPQAVDHHAGDVCIDLWQRQVSVVD
jgi:hypothetical protein